MTQISSLNNTQGSQISQIDSLLETITAKAKESCKSLPDIQLLNSLTKDSGLPELDAPKASFSGSAIMNMSQEAMEAIRFAWENGKYTAAICAGPTVLADLGIPNGKNATCYPGCEGQMGSANMVPGAAAVTDGKLITGTSAGCAIPFGLALIAALKGQEAADAIAAQIVIR